MNGAGPNIKSLKLNSDKCRAAANNVISLWSKSTIGVSLVAQRAIAGRLRLGEWCRLAPDDILALCDDKKESPDLAGLKWRKEHSGS
jgi:hypothetical protein